MAPFSESESIKLDEATIWLLLRELARTGTDRVGEERDPAALIRRAHDLARSARLEVEILRSREAVAIREVLAVIEAALRRVQETR